ncbi:MAG TPA: (d)CMP kinase [Dehalococcoidia bacterium]|nr:(d)CMP kinase [Dehalococcoidia bacterium]
MSLPRVIAIDGPVASGKSAVGTRLARRLGYGFLDTGLMYRGMTLAALRAGVGVEDEAALSRLADEVNLAASVAAEGTRVTLGGEDITPLLRQAEVEGAVSQVSRVARVRQRMVEQQRAIAREQPVVMVGRDIGTVVLPDADLKVYLDAGIVERARRRYQERVSDGEAVTLQEIEDALRNRDLIDSGREISPLRAAEDAHIINTDGLTIDEVVAAIEKLIEE